MQLLVPKSVLLLECSYFVKHFIHEVIYFLHLDVQVIVSNKVNAKM